MRFPKFQRLQEKKADLCTEYDSKQLNADHGETSPVDNIMTALRYRSPQINKLRTINKQ